MNDAQLTDTDRLNIETAGESHYSAVLFYERALQEIRTLRAQLAMDASTREPEHGTTPSVWVQWKGTRVCFDFWCECSAVDGDFGHADIEYSAYAIECGRCGRKYDMPQTLPLQPFTGQHDAKPTDWEDTAPLPATGP